MPKRARANFAEKLLRLLNVNEYIACKECVFASSDVVLTLRICCSEEPFCTWSMLDVSGA